MPTEYRSSNAEMVSELLPCPFCGQQEFLIERLDSDASVVICQGLTGPHEACLARGPVGLAQNEGEEQPGRDKAVELWNARAEQHQGEPIGEVVAFGRGLHEIAWSQGKMPRLGAKLYTHADPGEVEQLRTELAGWKEQCHRFNDDAMEWREEHDSLRAKLAERDALLDRVVDHAKFWHDHPYAEVVEGIAKDYKALSVSAEVKS